MESLISHGRGDIGRLAYILEKLKQNRTLYVTDQKYIEKMLKAYPMHEREDPNILRETFRTAQVNQELKTELKFAYEEIERFDAQLNQLKKRTPASKSIKAKMRHGRTWYDTGNNK